MVTATSSDGLSYVASSSYTVVPDLAEVQVGIGDVSEAAVGTRFSEKVTVTKAGPPPASDVITGLLVPRWLSVTNAGGGLALGPAIYWSDGSIAADSTVTRTVTFHVAPNARGSARIAVAAASIQVKDPNYANNAAAIVVSLGHSNRLPHAQSRRERQSRSEPARPRQTNPYPAGAPNAGRPHDPHTAK